MTERREEGETALSSTGTAFTGAGGIGHRRESSWQAMQDSLSRRRSTRRRDSLEKNLASLAPGTRVMFLLKENTDVPALFTEMGEVSGTDEWRQTARWVKFEEDVEEGGNRWSKPHVATLSLHSLFELRSCLTNGLVLIDLEAMSLPELVDRLLQELVDQGRLDESDSDRVAEVLLRRHLHQYEQARHQGGGGGGSSQGGGSGFLNAVRSISDIGKNFSHGRNLAKSAEEDSKKGTATQLELPKVGSVPKEMSRDSSMDMKGNTHFMKKLPHGAEASNVLVGEADFLTHHLSAFVRLKQASVLGDLTEVPVPTRFVFVLLGPTGHGAQYREIGRAIATLMSDEIFHDVAYQARNRDDLLDGVDEFLDQVTVLPPGEWDPNIRIEPPSVIPSQEKRKHVGQELLLLDKHKNNDQHPVKKQSPTHDEDEPDGGHAADPALKRTGRLFGGLMADIRRKAPFYLSDFTDSFNLQSVATVCFMYFALLAPIVTFGGLLEEATHQRMAAMENLFGGAICGFLYHLFSGQPLTIIGSTGPVLVFETIVFDMCTSLGFNYLSFRLWVHIWTFAILMIMVATDASSLVSYITRFTEESFATLIAIIFVYEAIAKVFNTRKQLDVIPYSRSHPNGSCYCIDTGASANAKLLAHRRRIPLPMWNETMVDYGKVPLGQCQTLLGQLQGDACYPLHDKFLMSLVLMVGTFFLATTLKGMRNSRYFPSRVRQVLSDFAVMISIVLMTSLDVIVGINTPKLNVPSTFRPTWEGRGWFIGPFDGNPWWTAILAVAPALLACILIFMDQQITTVIVNRKENKLNKGCGYHLDLFVLSFLIILVGFLGLPVYVAATVLSINHVNSLRVESESRAPGEVAHFVGCREQRVTGAITFLLLGLSVLMTGVLGHIPMPVLYGVFLYMGIAALGGIQLFDRILLLFMPMKYQPDTIYIRHVPISVIHLFTACQVLCLAVLWIIKSIKSTSITFPIMLVMMVAVRKLMEKFFKEKDLRYLDDKMPDFHLRKKEDLKRRQSQAASGAQEIEIDLDQNQGTLRAIKTEGHLHIPMASGNVIKIPLSAIQESSHDINISKEVNKSGLWKHIASESNTSLPRLANGEKESRPVDDDEHIMIKVVKPSPHSSSMALNAEAQPLLVAEKNESAV